MVSVTLKKDLAGIKNRGGTRQGDHAAIGERREAPYFSRRKLFVRTATARRSLRILEHLTFAATCSPSRTIRTFISRALNVLGIQKGGKRLAFRRAIR